MLEDVIQTPLSRFYQWEATQPDHPCFVQPVNGTYHTYRWADVAGIVRRIAYRIDAMNLEQGSRIAILAKNCVEWIMTDLAIMMTGHVSVPIFATAGSHTIEYVAKHADVKLAFIGKLDDTESQLSAMPDGIPTVAFPYEGVTADEIWSNYIDCPQFTGCPEPDLDALMTIIYTSGSTGSPKGVMHTFRSMSWAGKQASTDLQLTSDERLLSYLPLAHITERVLIEMTFFQTNTRLFFVESLDTFQRDVQRCKPTIFVSVPRLWTKFQMGILGKIPQRKLNILLRIPLVSHLVKRKIRAGLGLSDARICASGSAPIPPSVLYWFARLGIEISEGWGMTENAALGTASLPFKLNKVGSIGRPWGQVKIRLTEEGELLVKSMGNMLGYYQEEEKTRQAFTEDGYLRTGDKAIALGENYFKITGRIKDIFKTTKGKYVTPAPIEAKLMENVLIEQVCVTGTSLPQPIALLVLSEEGRQQSQSVVSEALADTLRHVNSGLESHQRLDRLIVMRDSWDTENGLLTPTLKVKRHVLEERFQQVITSRYNESVVWAK